VDQRRVLAIERNGSFRLDLADGDSVRADRTIVAAGIMPFAWTPPEFRGLPAELASHSSTHRDLGRFRGQRVIVIGGGQSALESAALLHELGADVEVLVRRERIYFLRRARGVLHRLGPITRAIFAPAEVGPAGVSRLVLRARSLPAAAAIAAGSLRRPLASARRRRVAAGTRRGVPMTFNARVVEAREQGGQVELTLADTSQRRADHVLLATGYRVDIAGYDFLPHGLLERIARVGGYPRLRPGFESSVPGLHFLGAPSAWSFGPLMRFVAGTEFAAPALTRAVLGRRH
jgi:cation diffusion facilitator CzcD-associated flavoprotein CzcO